MLLRPPRAEQNLFSEPICKLGWTYWIQLFWINSIVPNAPFLYPLNTSENCKVFWCFQRVEKGCIGNEWVNLIQIQATFFQSGAVVTKWCKYYHKVGQLRITTKWDKVLYKVGQVLQIEATLFQSRTDITKVLNLLLIYLWPQKIEILGMFWKAKQNLYCNY